jgi:hypothetical protein
MLMSDQPSVQLRDRQRIEKWTRWMQHTPDATQADPSFVWSQIAELSLHRQFYRQVIRMAQNAELPNSSFWQYFHSTHLRSQAAGIRRQADAHKDVISLRRILEELHRDLCQITGPGWVAEPSDALTAAEVAADIDRLVQGVSPVTELVDWRVAHMDRRSVAAPLTVTTVDAALDVLVAVFQRYARYLMSATVYFDVTITDDWQAIFRRAWLPEPP